MSTFTAPNGVKLRCTSKRRFWVVQTWTSERTGMLCAQVEFRTDNAQKARKESEHWPNHHTYDSRAKRWVSW